MVEDARARNMETVHRVGEAQGGDDTWKGVHLGMGSRDGILQPLTSLVFHFSQDQLLAHPARLNLREETFTPSLATGHRFGSEPRIFITYS